MYEIDKFFSKFTTPVILAKLKLNAIRYQSSVNLYSLLSNICLVSIGLLTFNDKRQQMKAIIHVYLFINMNIYTLVHAARL
jgi:hypothetical protein